MGFHYVLRMGAIFAIFAAFNFWFPVLTGLSLEELLLKCTSSLCLWPLILLSSLSTLRASRNASALHRLPGLIYSVKPGLFFREAYKDYFCNYVYYSSDGCSDEEKQGYQVK